MAGRAASLRPSNLCCTSYLLAPAWCKTHRALYESSIRYTCSQSYDSFESFERCRGKRGPAFHGSTRKILQMPGHRPS